jgi:hypothetical protein
MPQALALLLSIAIEAVIAFAAVRALRWGGGGRAAISATVGTLITHPIVWHAVPVLEPILGYIATVVLVETAVVIVESGPYWLIVPLAWPRALTISLIANGASASTGFVFYALTG